MRIGILGVAVAISLYMFVPFIVTRVLEFGVLKRGRDGSGIALTFDDGPHPVYTPQLLDLLGRYGIKATFFVLGERAARFPDLIRRIHQEGHCLGIHNYTHRSNWIMAPWTVFRGHLDRSVDVIERIIGERPIYYRPPWGILNVFDLLGFRPYRKVLWSHMISDWREFRDGDEVMLQDKLRRCMEDGAIVLLHDCGDTPGADKRAPEYMLKSLAGVLLEMEGKHKKFVRIDEVDRAVRAGRELA